MATEITQRQRAEAVMAKVKDELPGVWLGGRQRMVLEQVVADAIKTACREALQGQRELLQRIDAHLDTMMGDGSGLPFQTFLTQTALLRGQVKAVLARLANEGG